MANGNLTLWDPNVIIQNSSQGDNQELNMGLLSEIQLANNPIFSLEFNPHKPNLIACGGDEVILVDISKAIDSPVLFTPGEANSHEGYPISCVSWNKKISHILASVSDNGLTTIWDLKVKESIFSFSDNQDYTGSRKVKVTWNPEIPTQLAVVYDDEKYPELQIWDLRNPQGPITSFPAHNKGIYNIDWCISDPSLILTGGRDNKICFWNYKTGEMVGENIIDYDFSQVIWSPKLPAIYSVSSNDGDVQVYSLNNDTQMESNLSNYAPKWLKPPVGARFSFDGRLIIFSEKSGSVLKEIFINDTNTDIDAAISEFEEDLKINDVLVLSEKKMNRTDYDEKDKLEWSFIKAAKSDDNNELIKALGYSKNEIIKQAEQMTGKSHRKKEQEAPIGGGGVKTVKTTINYTKMSDDQASNFFDNLRIQKDKNEKKDLKLPKVIQEGVEKEHIISETSSKNINWNAGIEKLIKENILVGNIEGAVDCALKCGRVAEALTLAYTKGHEFFISTVKTHFTASKEPFLKTVIKNLAEDDIEELVESYSLTDWKECLALIATQCEGKELRDMINIIGDRFMKEKKDSTHAVLCYILARNIQGILEIYMNNFIEIPRSSTEKVIYLIKTVEKILALSNIFLCSDKLNPHLDTFIYELALIFQQYNHPILSMQILALADPKDIRILRIRDRIIQNSRNNIQNLFSATKFPFQIENVGTKSAKAKPQAKPESASKPIVNKGVPLNTFKPDIKSPVSGPSNDIAPPKGTVNGQVSITKPTIGFQPNFKKPEGAFPIPPTGGPLTTPLTALGSGSNQPPITNMSKPDLKAIYGDKKANFPTRPPVTNPQPTTINQPSFKQRCATHACKAAGDALQWMHPRIGRGVF